MQVEKIDLAAFGALFEATVAPGFTAWEAPYVRKAFSSDEKLIDVGVKTYRIATSCDPEDDCCGTAYPAPEAIEAAKALAALFGLSVTFEECEKGWASLYFKAA
jgi:hypothetical protein